MESGDRLGHALALGIDVEEWYIFKNYHILLPKQDYLDNLMWIYHKLWKYKIDGFENLKEKIQEEFNVLFSEIYSMNFSEGEQKCIACAARKQGYNYGNGYISWALEKFGGYSEANALQFSQEQAAAHGWPRYGDPEYVPHVLRYYSGGGLFAGLFGNGQLVTIAKSQLGNEGGQKFWSWYGFDSREEWCACFVSWCADQAGLIQSGAVPKFSLCTDGKNWFQNQGRWQGAGSMPSPGAIIFFDWDHDGTCDHVGIVERCDGTTVYTIEGNSGDAVRERNYAINSDSIMGYGMVVY